MTINTHSFRYCNRRSFMDIRCACTVRHFIYFYQNYMARPKVWANISTVVYSLYETVNWRNNFRPVRD